MKAIIGMILLAAAGQAVSAGHVQKLDELLTFTNRQGRVFWNARLVQADKDGVVFRDTNGIARVAWTNLSVADRSRMGVEKFDQELIDGNFAASDRKKKLDDAKLAAEAKAKIEKLKAACEKAMFKSGFVREWTCRETGATAVVKNEWFLLDFQTKKSVGETMLVYAQITNPRVECVTIRSEMDNRKIAEYDRVFGLSLK
jgi:hypothetical protein